MRPGIHFSPYMAQVERLGFTLVEDLGQQAESKVWTRAGRGVCPAFAPGACNRRDSRNCFFSTIYY